MRADHDMEEWFWTTSRIARPRRRRNLAFHPKDSTRVTVVVDVVDSTPGEQRIANRNRGG